MILTLFSSLSGADEGNFRPLVIDENEHEGDVLDLDLGGVPAVRGAALHNTITIHNSTRQTRTSEKSWRTVGQEKIQGVVGFRVCVGLGDFYQEVGYEFH